jgi:hypothetical protein
VTKNEFRLVAFALAALVVVVGALAIFKQWRAVPKQPAILPSTRSTPIMVRGGAMTAFAERSKWTKVGASTYCLDINCAGASGHESVQISAVGGRFYKLQMPHHGSHGDNLRFLIDSSAGCAQDEDLCVRMAELVVTDSNGMVLPSLPCPDGDCSVEIGIQ